MIKIYTRALQFDYENERSAKGQAKLLKYRIKRIEQQGVVGQCNASSSSWSPDRSTKGRRYRESCRTKTLTKYKIRHVSRIWISMFNKVVTFIRLSSLWFCRTNQGQSNCHWNVEGDTSHFPLTHSTRSLQSTRLDITQTAAAARHLSIPNATGSKW